MKEFSIAREWLASAGIKVTEAPGRVLAECFKPGPYNGRLRPAISFDPADRESVERARRIAVNQYVPIRACGEYCNLPCKMRRLEDSQVDYLMSVFGVNNTGSDNPENPPNDNS